MADLWSDFTQQPILAIHSGTWANVIAESTRCLQHCMQQQLTHLDNRARALAISGNFEAALKDAARIQQLFPSSAGGYLCAGHVYSLQGRQKVAIAIYDQGLAAAPLSDPFRQLLIQARSIAQERDSKRIDFIKKLPLEIITNVASRFMSGDDIPESCIREYLCVSRLWRRRLSRGVRDLHIDAIVDDDSFLEDCFFFRLVGPSCTSLKLDTNAFWLRELMESRLRFPSLRALSVSHIGFPDMCGFTAVEDDEDQDYARRIVVDSIVSFRASRTLTHLTLLVGKECDIPLGKILSTCPNLVDLQTSWIDMSMSTAPTCCPNLKSLSFMFGVREDRDYGMDDITKRLPGLERLMASPFYYAKDLRIIQNNCPKLSVIGSHDGLGFPKCDHKLPLDDPTTLGVRTFYVKGLDEDYSRDQDLGNWEHVMEFMQRNRHTLQDVHFSTWLPFNEQPRHAAVTANRNAGTLNRVTSYTQQIQLQEHLRMARMVAQKSPHLKTFDLSSRYRFLANDVGALFDDLASHCELESVIVKLESNDPLMDMGGIERFIQHHSRIDSQLHTLILPYNARLSNDALDTLTALPQLKTLGFSLPLVQGEDADGANISRFIQKLGSGCPQLQRLELRSKDPIPDIVFVELSKLKIKSLHLTMLYLSTHSTLPASMLALLDCPQLQDLRLEPSWQTTKDSNNEYIIGALVRQIHREWW